MSDFPKEGMYLCYRDDFSSGWFIEQELGNPVTDEYIARIVASNPKREWAVFDFNRCWTVNPPNED